MRVYVAGPLRIGDRAQNVDRAFEAADRLLDAGHAPFVPHLFTFWNLRTWRSERVWLDLDLAWLRVCEALVRLPGASVGADEEVEFALTHRIEVYHSVEEFLRDWPGRGAWGPA